MIPALRPDPALPLAPRAAAAEEKRKILEEAIEEHFEYLLGCVLRLLRRMNVFERSQARSPGDIAGDVLADACVAVLRQAERFEVGRDPLPWILGFAINVAKRERERVFKANRAASERPEVSASELAGEDGSGEDVLEAHAANLELSLGLLGARRATPLETRQSLQGLLAPLSESDREVVVLSVFEGYDSPRLAQILGTSAPAARKRLQRALDRLRAHIRSSPQQFSWIENLPEMLELHDEVRVAKSLDAPRGTPSGAGDSRGQGAPCHRGGTNGEHPEQDPHTASASSRSASDAELTRSSMKSSMAAGGSQNVSQHNTLACSVGTALSHGGGERAVVALAAEVRGGELLP